MSEHSVDVLGTKLDILIADFQRFRTQDREKIKELYTEVHECKTEITVVKNTLEWHRIIVGVAFAGVATLLSYIILT